MNLPSREECEGWDMGQVAHFLCKNKMQECANTVHRLKINGQRLLSLSDSDMSRFSLIHQPQLQKIVQDIRKNDGSLLNKLRRLKSKPLPKVPARDYRDADTGDDELSEPEYDNDTYEDPREEHDDSYEPPPSHRAFSATPSTSYLRGEYVDKSHNPPHRPPRKPLRPASKASKQLPPEPTEAGSDEEDYINPDANDDDNYIEPEESPPPPNHRMHSGSRAGREPSKMHKPLSQRPSSPDVYEVPDTEEDSPSHQTSRLLPVPSTHSPSLPPKPSPRVNRRSASAVSAVQEPRGHDEYEVCDPDESSSNKPLLLPKPLPRERSPKPPLKPRPDQKPREFESRTLPVMQSEQKPSPRAFTLDLKRPKIPLPQIHSSKPPSDRGSVSAENGSSDQDKDAEFYRKPWYAGACDRRTADDVLLRTNKDGAFMVRKSSGQDSQQPYTLVVLYKERVYNIPIRFLSNSQQYALGREKKGEEYFSSVTHIIENHQRHLLVLIDTQSNSKDATKLCFPVKP